MSSSNPRRPKINPPPSLCRLSAGLLAVAVFLGANSLTGERLALAEPVAPALARASGVVAVANALGGTVTSYSPGVTGNADPGFTLSQGLDVPNAMAFDSSGDLWVANFGGNSVVEYLRHDLTGHPAVPALTITSDRSASLNSAAGLAFDAAGDLWVANDLSNTVVEYPKAKLRGGPLVPAVTLSSDNRSSLSGPDALAFDASGDLWVANYDNSTLVEYPVQRLVTGDRAPTVTISAGSSGSLNSPAGLAFDAAGDLWVTANLSNEVLEYARGRLSSGRLRPAVTISADAWGSLNSPEGLAFDRAGNLWVANYGNDSVAEFGPAELSSSGSWSPSVIEGPGTGLWSPGYIAVGPQAGVPARSRPYGSASLLRLLARTGQARVEIRCTIAHCSGRIEVVGHQVGRASEGRSATSSGPAGVLGSVAYSLARGRTGSFDVRMAEKARPLPVELGNNLPGFELVITVRGAKTVTSAFL